MREHVPLAPYTLYQIGGRARYFVETGSASELAQSLTFAAEKKVPFFVLGAGSNVLVSDKGFHGLVIRLRDGKIGVKGERLTVGAGVQMARAVAETVSAGLAGFEWGIGVPGTIGGSVRGNAGCFGGEMARVVESVALFDAATGSQRILANRECEFRYRDSVFKRHPEWVILSATLRLSRDEPLRIQERIRAVTRERAQKQDIGTKSCGCIFKNIPWERADVAANTEKFLQRLPPLRDFRSTPTIPASFLIDQAGLKSRRIGRIAISPKHANFFVNEGGGTAEEVVMLVSVAKDTVARTFGLPLEEEIHYLGF